MYFTTIIIIKKRKIHLDNYKAKKNKFPKERELKEKSKGEQV